MSEVRPVVFCPWQAAMMHPDLVLPPLFEIARQIPFIHVHAAPIAQMLNQAVDVFMQTDFTHFVNLDIDHIHPADVVHRLGRDVLQHPEIKMIGGLNFARPEPHVPCAWIERDGEVVRMTDWIDCIEPVELLGFGCVMIARDVFQQVEPPWFMYDYSDMSAGEDYQYPGSDMYFCKKVRDAGIKIYCDTSITSPHIGYKLAGKESYERQRERVPA